MFNIGCHLSVEGGYEAMGKRILSIGGDTFQFFTKNPRGRSNGKTPSPDDIHALCNIMSENGITYVLAHAPYTYNPASRDEAVREYTTASMAEELRFLESIPGAMYNFHPGCHVGQGADVGISFVCDMLNRILVPGMKTKVLIETMAGKGTELGRSFEEIRTMLDGVDTALRDCVGVCLDTCHVHDGGYHLATDPEGVLREFDRVIGLERLCAIHVNDSKNECGSAKDRHARLGEGFIPLEAIGTLITHPSTIHLPLYLETPCDLDGYAEEIEILKNFRRSREK